MLNSSTHPSMRVDDYSGRGGGGRWAGVGIQVDRLIIWSARGEPTRAR